MLSFCSVKQTLIEKVLSTVITICMQTAIPDEEAMSHFAHELHLPLAIGVIEIP